MTNTYKPLIEYVTSSTTTIEGIRRILNGRHLAAVVDKSNDTWLRSWRTTDPLNDIYVWEDYEYTLKDLIEISRVFRVVP